MALPFASAITLLTSDLIGEIAPPGAQWGIFSGGGEVITADSVVAFDYKQEWSISDYPVERGAFESYDKVSLPFDVRLRFTAGGNAANRAALLESIAAIAGTTALFDAVTPEVVYPSVTISHYDYRRTARQGLGLLQIDVWCLQVNENATLSSGTAQPDGAAQVNGGSVQPTDATSTQGAAVSSGIAGPPDNFPGAP